MVGIHDSVHISDHHAGPNPIWRTYMGIGSVNRVARADFHRMRMGFCKDIQDRYPYDRQEDDIQGSLEMVEDEVI